MSMPRILVVGSVNMDLVLEMDRVPAPGENLIGTRYSYLPGGKGANQAVAAARLGAEAAFVARRGSDPHGSRLAAALESDGVDIRHLTVSKDEPTGLAVIAVERTGQNRIVVYPGANMTLEPSMVEAALEDPYDLLLLQLEMPDAVVAAAYRAARARGIRVVLDAGPARAFDLSLVHGIDVLSPNQSEAAALSGQPCDSVENARRAAVVLAEKSGARFVVIKLGENGALLFANGDTTWVPAFAVDAVDPTAAGDAFTAALALRWLSTGDLQEAAQYGNAAGALAASKLGAQASLPDRRAVEAFLKSQPPTRPES